MLKPSMESIITRQESYYKFVVAVAKRAREIAEEIEEKGVIAEEKPVKFAVEEFAAGRYKMTPSGDEAREIN